MIVPRFAVCKKESFRWWSEVAQTPVCTLAITLKLALHRLKSESVLLKRICDCRQLKRVSNKREVCSPVLENTHSLRAGYIEYNFAHLLHLSSPPRLMVGPSGPQR